MGMNGSHFSPRSAWQGNLGAAAVLWLLERNRRSNTGRIAA